MRRAAAIVSALLLASCFESKTPLITAGDFPLPDANRYTVYEWNPELNQFAISESGFINRVGDHYEQRDEISFYDGVKPFVVKSIGDGFYIAQQKNDSSYVYDLLKVDGNDIYQYGITCTAAERKFVPQGLLDSVTADSPWGNTCAVSDFGKLARVLRAIAVERPRAAAKYTIQR